ncbi:MAG: heavy-metal-associated domain-containing protein [Brevinematales bacterium]
MEEIKLLVKGMKCEGCAHIVKEVLSSVVGVKEVRVDLLTGEVSVIGDVSPEVLVKAIHEKTSYKAEMK